MRKIYEQARIALLIFLLGASFGTPAMVGLLAGVYLHTLTGSIYQGVAWGFILFFVSFLVFLRFLESIGIHGFPKVKIEGKSIKVRRGRCENCGDIYSATEIGQRCLSCREIIQEHEKCY